MLLSESKKTAFKIKHLLLRLSRVSTVSTGVFRFKYNNIETHTGQFVHTAVARNLGNTSPLVINKLVKMFRLALNAHCTV